MSILTQFATDIDSLINQSGDALAITIVGTAINAFVFASPVDAEAHDFRRQSQRRRIYVATADLDEITGFGLNAETIIDSVVYAVSRIESTNYGYTALELKAA